jgi:hypothetical protein
MVHRTNIARLGLPRRHNPTRDTHANGTCGTVPDNLGRTSRDVLFGKGGEGSRSSVRLGRDRDS